MVKECTQRLRQKIGFHPRLECLDRCDPCNHGAYAGWWLLARDTRNWTCLAKMATYRRWASYACSRNILLDFGRKALETTS